jgi:ATP-dependent RNA helicase RhlE
LIPQQRQSLMFSATFSSEIKKLADKLLKEPVLIEVAQRNSITELVTHVVHPVEPSRKRELLAHLIKSHDLKQVLVFVRTKHGASHLAQQLERDGITATAIHGDKSQPQRTQALAEFKQGMVRVLVATDVAARGLDIEDLPHVVNFELPTTPEDYIHRIGRTGRAGTKGDAISLVCESENELLEGIQKLLKFKLDMNIIAGFEPEALHHAAVSENSRGRRNSAERTVPEQKRTSGSRVGGVDETNSASRSKSSGQRGQHGGQRELKAGRTKTPEDPLFSQPYTPSAKPSDTQSTPSSINTATSSAINKQPAGHARPGQKNEPLAALFRPRSPQSKQDE